MERPKPVPLHILTGFLGAGKTTLLNRWLKDPALADTLVLVNEFGDIALDHLLIEAATDGMVLLPSGCVCCAVRDDLVTALENLLRKRDNQRIAPFRRVILETTGVADPAPVLATILKHPYLKLRFAVAGIITVIDAVNGADTLAQQPEAVQQAALADLVLVSKTDLADPMAIKALTATLQSLNPLAPVRRAVDCPAAAALSAPLMDAKPAVLPAFSGVRHDGIRHFTLTSEAPVRAESFDLFLDLLRAQKGSGLLRVKGLLALQDDPDAPVVIHAVQHVLHPVQRLPSWPDEDRRTRLVFIVRDVDPGFVAALWDAFHGEAQATIDPPAPA